MLRIDPNAALNRVLTIINRSFPTYLITAAPWTHPGDEGATKVVQRIVADYEMYVGRLVDLLLERRELQGFGDYPMAFTDTNDLGLDYLVSELIFYQKQDIAELEQCVAQLKSDPTGKALAEEVLGNARGHLQSLEELPAQPAATAS
jgi:hypothetical protein